MPHARPPAKIIISTLLLRSGVQHSLDQRDYLKFKKLLKQMVKDDDRKDTLRVFFMEKKITKDTFINMKFFDSDKHSVPELNFKSDETFEEFIKARMEYKLGLVKNPIPKQLEGIIYRRKIKRKSKGKTVYFKYFIDEIVSNSDDIIDVDVEIVKDPIGVTVRNDKL